MSEARARPGRWLLRSEHPARRREEDGAYAAGPTRSRDAGYAPGRISEEKGPRRAIHAAPNANGPITVGKSFAGSVSGSAALLATGVHPAADTTSRLFLIISLGLLESPPDPEHSYNYGKDRSSRSQLVAFDLFTAGALPIYQGVMAVLGGEDGKIA